MERRRTIRFFAALALPALAVFPVGADAAPASLLLAQSSTTTAPDQQPPVAPPQPQQPAAPQPAAPQPVAPPPPQEPQPPARAACLDQFGSAVANPNIYFNWASSHLRRQDVATIDSIASYAKSCPEARFRVDGHTDSSGPKRYNQFFSEQRVNTVIAELEARGVDVSRFSPAIAHGEGDPKESNASREGRQANRRVEIVMTE